MNNVQQTFIQPNVSNFWDNDLQGNFWSDYSTRYPNATEVDKSGVWNMPYVIDAINEDNYPLLEPCGTVVSESGPEQEPFLKVYVVAIAVILVIVMGILVYFLKKQNR